MKRLFAFALTAVSIMAATAAHADNDAPEYQSMRAFILLTRFALNLGPYGAPPIRIINPENAIQEGHNNVYLSDFADYIKMDDGPCTYEKRSFFPKAADDKYDPATPPYRYVIWHTQIDFRKVSPEWETRGPFLSLKGEPGALCQYKTAFAPGTALDEVRRLASSRKGPPAGTTMRCSPNLEGATGFGAYRLQVMKWISYFHSHVCAPAELPF